MTQILTFWRVLATASAFVLFGVGGAVIPWLAYPIIRFAPVSKLKRQRMARGLIQKVFSFFVFYMRALGIFTVSTHGLEKLKRDGLLVLANHPTLIDVVFLVSFLPNADCVVKSALRSNPAMRGFLSLTGFITNDSGESLIEDAGLSLASGGCLVIFPEGTRTKPGGELKFQRGAANIALRTGTAITPVLIKCDPLALSKDHKWYEGAKYRLRFSFQVGDDLSLSEYINMPAGAAARRLTTDLQVLFNEGVKNDGFGTRTETIDYRCA